MVTYDYLGIDLLQRDKGKNDENIHLDFYFQYFIVNLHDMIFCICPGSARAMVFQQSVKVTDKNFSTMISGWWSQAKIVSLPWY